MAAAAAAEAGVEEEEEEDEEAEEVEEDTEEEDSGPQRVLTIDPEGRIEHGGSLRALTAGCEFSTATPRDWAALRGAAERAAVQATKRRKAAYSRGTTYWIGARDEPRCALEAAALKIFKHHTVGASFDASHSGAEWWTLSLGSDSAVGWHWDKDYGLDEPLRLNVYPQLATVTYLSDVGPPTVVVAHAAPPEMIQSPAGSAKMLWVSHPSTGRHLAFDGRWLHGAPEELRHRPAPSPGRKRITLLVNMWLNHRPSTAVRLPQKAAPQLGPVAAGNLTLSAGVRTRHHSVASSCGASPRGVRSFSWRFVGPSGRTLRLDASIPDAVTASPDPHACAAAAAAAAGEEDDQGPDGVRSRSASRRSLSGSPCGHSHSAAVATVSVAPAAAAAGAAVAEVAPGAAAAAAAGSPPSAKRPRTD